MNRFVVAAIVLCVSMATGQDIKHAPSVQQCRADEKLWSYQLEQPGGLAVVPELTFDELQGRIDEMATAG
jgi:hypothetical protein